MPAADGALQTRSMRQSVSLASCPCCARHSFFEILISAVFLGTAGSHTAVEGVRLATRAMLLLAAYCRETGAPAEANYALMRDVLGYLVDECCADGKGSCAPIVLPKVA